MTTKEIKEEFKGEFQEWTSSYIFSLIKIGCIFCHNMVGYIIKFGIHVYARLKTEMFGLSYYSRGEV